MNPVVVAQLIAAVVAVVLSVPLILRKVKMNDSYGVRIAAAFESNEAWFEINHYGGRLLLFWGFAIAVTAMVGALLEKENWVLYDWAALVTNMGGLAVVVVMTYRHARRREKA